MQNVEIIRGNPKRRKWEELDLWRTFVVEKWWTKQMRMESRKIERLQKEIVDEGRNAKRLREFRN